MKNYKYHMVLRYYLLKLYKRTMANYFLNLEDPGLCAWKEPSTAAYGGLYEAPRAPGPVKTGILPTIYKNQQQAEERTNQERDIDGGPRA